MTEERQAFIDAIIHDPENDATRLVFADWLEENQERERAEFIRVQVAHALATDGDKRGRLKSAEVRLLWGHPGRLEDWFPLPKISAPRRVIRRGFLEEIHCDLASWITHGKSICREHPLMPHANMLTDLPISGCNWFPLAVWEQSMNNLGAGVIYEAMRRRDRRVAGSFVDRLPYRTLEDAGMDAAEAAIEWARGER